MAYIDFPIDIPSQTTTNISKERELEKVNAFYLQKEAEVSYCYKRSSIYDLCR